MAVLVLSAWVPTLADLWAWGRADDWVGLLSWAEALRDEHGQPQYGTGAGWLPAGVLRCSTYATRDQLERIPRLVLSSDAATWPRVWLPAGNVVTWHGRLGAPLPRPGFTGSAYG